MPVYLLLTCGPVFAATTKNDKTMYVFLVAAILLGLLTTLVASASSVTATTTALARTSAWMGEGGPLGPGA